jgi:catechol 2,3-dioxygenase-like lactoylglutathione lyase family enzyme
MTESKLPEPELEPKPRLTAVTLGVRDFHASLRFYEALGFARRLRSTGDEVAFLDAGGVVLALYRWDQLAQDAALEVRPIGAGFRGTTLAWNCASRAGVDAAFVRALAAGATLLKAAQATSWGGYSGYFADPDGHPWEIVHAPGFAFSPAGQLLLPD